ncbi:MAG: SMP-30/gluconolactonase/LRE family protein [Bacteroidales bacterium]|jgi:hypothetical protein|nr:SMP-30/gluconolactonase/LRE family protein [Bacteroidales bacterium]
MNKLITYCLLLALSAANLPAQDGASVYRQKPGDREAFYFPVSDGKKDVSRELQEAINRVKKEYGFGIVFIPEGVYRISQTIYIPRAIRLIGYGKERPLIVLAKNSPGFRQEVPGDKGRASYMFWFVNSVPEEGRQVADAGASTFYSAMSNINLKIEDGNPHAVALRTHFAQHSFVSHVDIRIGNGKAGLFEVGNEMHNVRFFGGDYGIYTTKASPGWPMMMVDTYFEKQKKAAIRTQEGGLTIVRLQARDVPTVLDIEPNYSDRLFLENCLFDNVSGPAIVVSNENNAGNQISLKNVDCRNVPVLVKYRRSETTTSGKGKMYRVTHYTHGLHIDNLAAEPEMRTDVAMEELTKLPPMAESDIPALPDMSAWVNIQELGAKGDNETDDTEVFREAIRKHANIYVPQGWYIISEPLVLQANTSLIGLNPVSTQLILKESTPTFSGFGSPVALVETPRGGVNIVNGLGLNTGAYNYRAVGCKWMAGARSYMNDVKFMGGHGGMNKGPQQPWRGTPQGISSPSKPVAAQGMDYAWDNQYWSLWVTGGGGGTFKDIWTASTYCTNGVYVSNTSTEGRIYAMSIEHHVRNEARFSHVSNWKVYAFQLEEESRESRYCQPLELDNCSDMVFANLYMFQVIRVNTPYPYSIRTWNCRDIEMLNVHNYAQTKYTTALPLYDAHTGLEVRPWEFTRLYISGKEQHTTPLDINLAGKVQQHAAGFEFAQGTAGDSKGNIYFCEQRLRRLYKWSVETNTVSPLADFPWEPLSLACDTKDNLLVVFRYNPQPGYMVDGKQESVRQLPDAGGTSFSGWGNSGFATWVYSMNPDKAEESIGLLRKTPMDSVAGVRKALYPANRWRDYHDFNTVVMYRPQECFVAPDGVTIIPCQYDLARSCAVLEAFPGKPFYAADEYDKRMVRMEVAADGTLSGMSYFVEAGEFGSAVDKDGNLYVADGQVYIYDKTGKRTGQINVPERPLTMAFGGKDKDILFINSHHSLFSVKIK